MSATRTDEAYEFFYEHAGFGWTPGCETREQGHRRCARALAEAEQALHADESLFVVWDWDDIDSSSFEDTDEPRPLYIALLCMDTDGKPHVVRGYDPSDGIFERPGVIVGSLGGIDLAESDDPYKRVIEAELYQEFEAQRESNITRGEN